MIGDDDDGRPSSFFFFVHEIWNARPPSVAASMSSRGDDAMLTKDSQDDEAKKQCVRMNIFCIRPSLASEVCGQSLYYLRFKCSASGIWEHAVYVAVVV